MRDRRPTAGPDPLGATAIAPAPVASADTLSDAGSHGSADTVLSTPAAPDRVDLDAGSVGALLSSGVRYEERRLLGQGGMGAVLACRDVRIGREVAVKRMLGGHGAGAVTRFLREARVQGQLEHPAIVPVHDLEVEDGIPYFVMKRVRGVTLDDALAAAKGGDPEATKRYGRRRLLSAFVTVALAVDFAHARGVVHRDLKPANIMLGDYGEVHLLDWGVARVLGAPADADGTAVDVGDPSVHSTAHGAIVGTPGYLSPEQARGATNELDGRADVYALGAILFEILAQEPLHQGRSARELLDSALAGAADPRPSERRPDLDIPPELDAACIRSLALDPAERWSSARELSDAVERFLDGDRDVALRRGLAETHVGAARAALGQIGESGATGREAREEALREATRAMALDPEHEAGRDVVAHLLLDTPKELPPEAVAEMEASQQDARLAAARFSTMRGVGLLVLAPTLVWMGVRDWTLFGTLAALLVGLVVSNVFWWRLRKGKLEGPVDYVPMAVSLGLIATLSRIFGPFVVTPTLALLNGAVFSVQTGYRLPTAWGFASGLAAIGPWLLELVGLLPSTVSFDRGSFTVQASLAAFPSGTPIVLGVITFVSASMPLFLLQRLRRMTEANERRVFLHAWHLRRLLPAREPRRASERPAR